MNPNFIRMKICYDRNLVKDFAFIALQNTPQNTPQKLIKIEDLLFKLSIHVYNVQCTMYNVQCTVYTITFLPTNVAVVHV